MAVTFGITAEDFTTYYLYVASKSKVITGKRKATHYFFTVSFMVLGFCFYYYEALYMAIGFLVLGILWLIFYPKFSKNSLKRRYERYIAENYKNRISRKTEISASKDYVSVVDGKTDSKIHVSEFDKLIETERQFFLQLKSGTAFIIPKKEVDSLAFKAEMQQIGLAIADETHWKWQ